MDAPITLEDLLAAMQPPAKNGEEGLTTEEIAERLHRSVVWVRSRLKALQRQGRLRVGEKTVIGIDGRLARVPAYSLRKEEEPCNSIRPS